MTPASAPQTALSLFQIEQQLQDLLAFRELAEGPEELAAADAELEKYFALQVRKVDAISHAVRSCERVIVSAKEEKEHWAAIEDTWTARLKRIKEVTLRTMQAFGAKVFENRETGAKLAVRGNGGVEPLEVDEALLPVSMQRITVTLPFDLWCELVTGHRVYSGDEDIRLVAAEKSAKLEPDNERIRQALKRGEKVDGAKLGNRGEHLRVS